MRLGSLVKVVIPKVDEDIDGYPPPPPPRHEKVLSKMKSCKKRDVLFWTKKILIVVTHFVDIADIIYEGCVRLGNVI